MTSQVPVLIPAGSPGHKGVDGGSLRVLVIEDIRLHRENLVANVAVDLCVADVVGAAGGPDALGQLEQCSFDVVLLSIATAGSWASCRELVAAADPGQVIAYGISGGEDEVVACAAAGIRGYLLRDEPLSELMKAVATAGRGDVWCPPRVAEVLMRRMGLRGALPDLQSAAGRLTAREREILALIDGGMSNKEIARRLGIEIRTVKNHVHNLLEKLQVHRRGEAAALLFNHTHALRA